MAGKEKIKREVLPIPDTPYMGLTTFNAKDPDSSFPKFEPLRDARVVVIALLANFAVPPIRRAQQWLH